MRKVILLFLFVLGVSAVDRAVKAHKAAANKAAAHFKGKDAQFKSQSKDGHFKHQISKIKRGQKTRRSVVGDADYMKESDECPTLNYGDWKELGRFRPSGDLIHGFWGSTMGTIYYQPITHGWGNVNLDLYEVEITTLPTDHSTALDFFHYWRKDLAKGDDTQFVDTDDCSFKAFDSGEGDRWASDSPITTYITIHLARLLASLTSFSFDDGSVMCTQFSTSDDAGYWTFSVIHSFRDGGHPVSGNRRFGFYKQDGKTIYYTKGVDRVTTLIDRLASAAGQVFENADKTWVSMQDKMVEYINANGGSAVKRPRLSVRCDWDNVWGSWTESCTHGVVEIDGGCHTTNWISCDDDATCEPNGDSPCESPGWCNCGTLECFCGRLPSQGKICDPWD